MPAQPLPVSPPDISAILTSLGVFSLAIAAVVAGIYKGIKEVKRGGAETGQEVKSAVIVESLTLRNLTDSNIQLVAAHVQTLEVLRAIDHSNRQLAEAIRDHRGSTRSLAEEQHRLKAATSDLVDQMRRARV